MHPVVLAPWNDTEYALPVAVISTLPKIEGAEAKALANVIATVFELPTVVPTVKAVLLPDSIFFTASSTEVAMVAKTLSSGAMLSLDVG